MQQNKTPYNEQGQSHGYWEIYNDNGTLWIKTNYINGFEFGYEQFQWTNGYEDEYRYYAR